jgi:hypothetical protein
VARVLISASGVVHFAQDDKIGTSDGSGHLWRRDYLGRLRSETKENAPMSVRDHDTGPNGVTVDDLIEKLFPVVEDLLRRIEGDEFTTNDFIDVMLSVPEAADAYHAAIRMWGENQRQSKMVIHGQIVPGALRKSSLVEWSGFAHGEADEFSVPAWWRMTGQG